MTYKIAIASSDGIYVDTHFGSASSFLIVEVDGDGSYSGKEARIVPNPAEHIETNSLCSSRKACGNSSDCTGKKESGCGGGHSEAQIDLRVSLIADCRCLICKKIGSGVERQLERKAITTFQVDNKVEEALKKITEYYRKTDNHISLRKNK